MRLLFSGSLSLEKWFWEIWEILIYYWEKYILLFSEIWFDYFEKCDFTVLSFLHLTVFSDFDLTTLLDSFVNTEHFIHFSQWARSTLLNLITQRKKIQFPCRNPLLHRQHRHNDQSVIASYLAERIYIVVFGWHSNVEHLWCWHIWHIWSKSVVGRFRYWYTVRHNTFVGFTFSIFIENIANSWNFLLKVNVFFCL